MTTLQQLFLHWAGTPAEECLAIGSASASSRRYFRLRAADGRTAIGTIAPDLRENQAFFAYTRHFRRRGLPVPEVYAVADDQLHYLQQDLGDQSLYSLLYDKRRQGGGFDPLMLDLYRQALADLAAFQQAGADLDFSCAIPRPAFDRQAILWDLYYFKYLFLKLAHIDHDEERLQRDFDHLTDYLLSADCNYFLYRDFNPRNIMVVESEKLKVKREKGTNAVFDFPLSTSHFPLYYIDYQGGRRGAAQYDVASLLYSAKSNLPDAIRTELLNHYLDLRHIHGDQRHTWLQHLRAYTLVRILQTLGAYGYRGLFEQKDYFAQSIPLALGNLRHLLLDQPFPIQLPELQRIVVSGKWKVESEESRPASAGFPLSTIHSPLNQLTVTILSFSYKQGLPHDDSGNGGGFIFDCRALPNPGRYPEYKTYTGKDRPVVDFLRREPAVDQFLDHAQALVAQSVDKYLERHFTHLQVAFGCTGGQHRSVYCAEQLAARLAQRYPDLTIRLLHREQDR